MANLIKVKPIDTASWHGKKGYESFRKPKTIQALVNSSTRTYTTGLNNVTIAFADPTTSSEEKVLTEQEYYSKLLKADLTNQFVDETPHPFWDSKPRQDVKSTDNKPKRKRIVNPEITENTENTANLQPEINEAIVEKQVKSEVIQETTPPVIHQEIPAENTPKEVEMPQGWTDR